MSSPRIGMRGEVEGEDMGDSSEECRGLRADLYCGACIAAVVVVVVFVSVCGEVSVATVTRGSSSVERWRGNGEAKAAISGGEDKGESC